MPEASRQQFINNIKNESQRLHQVVEQLLKLASLEKRQQLDDIEYVATDKLIRQLCDDKAAILQHKKLEIKIAPLSAAKVEAEQFLLQQLINNLLDNAIDFSPENSEITISDKADDNYWFLTIKDQGPGIPDYALPRIFDRFYSLARADTGKKSTGLGLSLVYEVVQLHRGSIDIHNHKQGGTEIIIQLPLAQNRA